MESQSPFIKSTKFKTNKIKLSFFCTNESGKLLLIEFWFLVFGTANAVYPTSQLLVSCLVSLYGSNYSTSVSKRGLVHYVDSNVFIRDSLSRKTP